MIKKVLVAIYLVSVILYFNHIQYMTDAILQDSELFTYKDQNDYSKKSIKLVYQNEMISITLYILIVCSYIVHLILQGIMMWKQKSLFIRIIFYNQQILIAIYALGQFIQIVNYDFEEELIKIGVYQTQKEDVNMDEDGEIAVLFWEFYLGFIIIIIVTFKIGYLIYGSRQYRKIMSCYQ